MLESLFLIAAMILQQPTPAQADALVLALISTPQPIGATYHEIDGVAYAINHRPLPVELGPALERFWIKEQLWGKVGWQWTPDKVRVEIEWTRQRWPND